MTYSIMSHHRVEIIGYSDPKLNPLEVRIGLPHCPGFGQDRVNFDQNPERDIAGQADLTWPNRAGYSIPCAAMLGSGWGGSCGGGNSVTGSGVRAADSDRCSLCSAVCVVYSPYLYRCCSCSLCLLFC